MLWHVRLIVGFIWGLGRRTVTMYRASRRERCRAYWKDDGTGNCRIPVCTTPCYNGGTCVAPNTCRCRSAFKGRNCADLTCSHQYPCYPGACRYPHACTCTEGFGGSHCLTLKEKYTAEILDCQLTLANIRRVDEKQMFFYSGPCSMNNTGADVLWSNQALFNYAKFSMRSDFDKPYDLPPRPFYVTNSRFGIVQHGYRVKHTQIKRDGVPGLYVVLDKNYNCPDHASYNSPIESVTDCSVTEDNYKINIEDGDIFSVTFKTKSGGFSELKNPDTHLLYKTQRYYGREVEKTIEFHFDFIAPVHCSEANTRCASTNEPITLQKDITRSPLSPRWSGWSDDRSGLDYYKLEIYKLDPNINGELLELKPLSPIFSQTISDTASPDFPTYIPSQPGMYSILLQTSDKANNSKIARRLVLYDNASTITVSTPAFSANQTIHLYDTYVGDGGIHVTTAISETGFMWQTGTAGKKTNITLDWTGHFVNKIHKDGKLLNTVLSYPSQFQNLSDSGTLLSEKVVAPKLDDDTGLRTKKAIPNINGITQFEYCKITTADREKPTHGWTPLPLEESFTFEESINDGQFLRLWIRATDIMNDTQADYTEVHFDNTAPIVLATSFKPNIVNNPYLYTSRVVFSASDHSSGVHRLDYKLFVGNDLEPVKAGRVAASKNNASGACDMYPECKCVLNECFLLNQSLPIDNCWFMVPQERLEENGTVEISVYNQALLKKTFTIDKGQIIDKFVMGSSLQIEHNYSWYGYNVIIPRPRQSSHIDSYLNSANPVNTEHCYTVDGHTTEILTSKIISEVGILKRLDGLKEYSGPTNIHVAKKLSNGVRLAWDLPKTVSCYGRMDITIMLVLGDGTTRVQHVHKEATFVDIIGLNADQAYSVKLNLGYEGTAFSALTYDFQTAPLENYTSGGIIAGIVVSILGIIAILIAVFVVLLRRGHMEPVRRGLRAMAVKYRQSRANMTTDNPGYFESKSREESIYMYEEVDFNRNTALHIARSSVVFDSLITTGNFALIYKSTLTNTEQLRNNVVVAKTLQEGFTEHDKMLMKAKINFMANKAIDHENILKFLGAVDIDSDVGPFMLFEFCEHGPMKKYLEERRNNVTLDLQENLYRFGLGVARGMQYLTEKQIVHKRLAARNVLLDRALQVKITGFGPLSLPTETEGESSGKRERIPVKWVAPECLKSSEQATEKSDMWSFGVVLWEIFSLGQIPYGQIKGSEIPSKLKNGTRLPKPENADDKWYGLMQKAWQYEPIKRPTFKQVGTELDEIFVAAPQDDYYYLQR